MYIYTYRAPYNTTSHNTWPYNTRVSTIHEPIILLKPELGQQRPHTKKHEETQERKPHILSTFRLFPCVVCWI